MEAFIVSINPVVASQRIVEIKRRLTLFLRPGSEWELLKEVIIYIPLSNEFYPEVSTA